MAMDSAAPNSPFAMRFPHATTIVRGRAPRTSATCLYDDGPLQIRADGVGIASKSKPFQLLEGRFPMVVELN
ncbi:MAG: hypothetical protein LAO07_18985, partial [Acidobacteriia bacterium]|nr:hypothetical protein [Terriglobia bacterium]